MESVELLKDVEKTSENAPPPLRFDENDPKQQQERLRLQSSILQAFMAYLNVREGDTYDTNAYFTHVFTSNKETWSTSPGARLHTLTQSTDEDTMRQIDAFVGECAVLQEWLDKKKKGNSPEDETPPLPEVPEALLFMVPEGDIPAPKPTLH